MSLLISSALSRLEKKNNEAERLVKCFIFIIINFFQKPSSFTQSLTQSLQLRKLFETGPPLDRHAYMYSIFPLGLKGIDPWQL